MLWPETGTTTRAWATVSSAEYPRTLVRRGTGLPGVHAIEVDERHRFAGTVQVGDARPQGAGHEGEVRVRVQRLGRPLFCRQLGPPLNLVVLVSGPFGKHRPEQVDVRHDTGGALVQPRRDPLVQVPGRRVKGAAQGAREMIEGVAVAGRDLSTHVEYIDASPRGQFERELDRGGWHQKRRRGAQTRPPVTRHDRRISITRTGV